jgi:hypothetical protein
MKSCCVIAVAATLSSGIELAPIVISVSPPATAAIVTLAANVAALIPRPVRSMKS